MVFIPSGMSSSISTNSKVLDVVAAVGCEVSTNGLSVERSLSSVAASAGDASDSVEDDSDASG